MYLTVPSWLVSGSLDCLDGWISALDEEARVLLETTVERLALEDSIACASRREGERGCG